MKKKRTKRQRNKNDENVFYLTKLLYKYLSEK